MVGATLLAAWLLSRSSEIVAAPSIESVIDQAIASRIEKLGSDSEELTEPEINVLLLGLDARKDSEEVHCDAIHLFTLNIDHQTLTITSVPRGTTVWIPGGPYGETEYYLANACAFAGLDYGIEQIEKITGRPADYVATVGFSQVMGLMRVLELPTTETLQWLRHRHSYAIGEPQRSHNQAVFMKDLLVRELGRFASDLSIPVQYVLYQFVDTDLDFATVRSLVNYAIEIGLPEHPEKIILAMKPYWETVDIHFDLDNPTEQIEQISNYIGPLLSEDDFSGRSSEDVQAELVDYLNYRLFAEEPVADIMEQMLWLQIEDGELREQYHYDFLVRYVTEADTDLVEEIDLITNYVLEMEALGCDEYASQGKELLSQRMN